MARFSDEDLELIQSATEVLGKELIDPGGIPGAPEFSDIRGLRRFVRSMIVEGMIDDNLGLTIEALEDAASALANAHKAAAEVSVDAPSDNQVEAFKEHLEALNRDIQGDQRFHAALKLADSLVKTMDSRVNS